MVPGPRRRGALIRGTNGQSNGIVPWLRTLDASVAAVNQGGRRKGAACVYLEPWHPDVEEFLRAAGQHRRGRPAHPQPEPGQLDPGRVHAPGRGRRDVVAVRPARGARAARPVGRGVRRRVPGGRGAGPLRAAGPGPGPVRPDDAHAGPDRQRLDDLQGRRQPAVQPDRRAGQRGAPVQPLHRDPRGVQRRRDRRVQPRLGQPRRPPRRRRHRLGAAARHGPDRGDVPRPGHRHQLLPDRAGGGEQPALAAGRPRADGPAGRRSSRCGCRSTRRPARELSTRISRGDLPDRAGDLRRPGRAVRRAPGVRRRPGPRGASCSPTCGASTARQTARWAALRERVAGARAAQLAAGRDRADRDHRLDRRLLRVHRAAGVQPVQARDAVRRVPAGQHRSGTRAEGARAVDRARSATAIKRAEGSVQGIADAAGRRAGAVPHRLGAAAAGADRPGRRPRPVHRPVASR